MEPDNGWKFACPVTDIDSVLRSTKVFCGGYCAFRTQVIIFIKYRERKVPFSKNKYQIIMSLFKGGQINVE
jgi:hypothetical protein